MIFLDANFLLAYFIKTEKEHKIAIKIYEKIKNEELIISNSVILEVMNVSNIKLKVSKELLKTIFHKLNNGEFGIIEDIPYINKGMDRVINYLPERIPLFDCLYIEIMNQLGIKQIATFDKHFNNKGIKVIIK
jgi:predicted nucleic acid-binding protein